MTELLLSELTMSNWSAEMALNKQSIALHFDRIADRRTYWYSRNRIYHEQFVKVCRPFLNPDSRVIELGCSTGDLLNNLNPAYGVGVDLSKDSISLAKQHYPRYQWLQADIEKLPSTEPLSQPFDIIILSDVIAYLDDIGSTFQGLHRLTHPNSRIIVSFWNWVWKPILKVAEDLGLKAPDLNMRMNWVSPANVTNMLELENYEILQILPGMLLPLSVPLISPMINSLAEVAFLRQFVLSNTIVARPSPLPELCPYSVSVIIPTRNEAGNIEAAVKNIPMMGTHTELIFVDGNSTDGTVENIYRQMALHPDSDIKFVPQMPAQSSDANTSANLMLKLGKGDAVRKGFAAATGDILMILDSDLTVPPEELLKFYKPLATGAAALANGTRFVYEQQAGAMLPLNRVGNVFFSKLFTWLLGQSITDTLCGTKALFKRDYDAIVANRKRFGDFDPFGDFDLLFGAAWLNYRIREVPVHYRERTYGSSKVRARLHGPMLGRMSLIALWHFKILPAGRRFFRRETPPKSSILIGLAVLALAWSVFRAFARLMGRKQS